MKLKVVPLLEEFENSPVEGVGIMPPDEYYEGEMETVESIDMVDSESGAVSFQTLVAEIQSRIGWLKEEKDEIEAKIAFLENISDNIPTIANRLDDFSNKFEDYNISMDGVSTSCCSITVWAYVSHKQEGELIEPKVEASFRNAFSDQKLMVDKSTKGDRMWIGIEFSFASHE